MKLLLFVGVGVLIIALLLLAGVAYSCYLSIPYDEWVKIQRELRRQKHGRKKR